MEEWRQGKETSQETVGIIQQEITVSWPRLVAVVQEMGGHVRVIFRMQDIQDLVTGDVRHFRKKAQVSDLGNWVDTDIGTLVRVVFECQRTISSMSRHVEFQMPVKHPGRGIRAHGTNQRRRGWICHYGVISLENMVEVVIMKLKSSRRTCRVGRKKSLRPNNEESHHLAARRMCKRLRKNRWRERRKSRKV